MIADFMTKPLQGTTFRKFRDIIMGIKGIESGNDVSNKKPSKATGDNKSNDIQATKSRNIGNGNLARY